MLDVVNKRPLLSVVFKPKFPKFQFLKGNPFILFGHDEKNYHDVRNFQPFKLSVDLQTLRKVFTPNPKYEKDNFGGTIDL